MSTAKHTLFGAAEPIPGWPGYLATEGGRILSLSRWRGMDVRPIAPVLNGKGYQKVCLTVLGKRCNRPVHLLVALAWIGPRPSAGYEVRHLDGDRLNNAATNLAWGTRKDNADDRERHGRTSRGERHSQAIREGLEARNVR